MDNLSDDSTVDVIVFYNMDSVTYYWVCYRRSLGLVLKIL